MTIKNDAARPRLPAGSPQMRVGLAGRHRARMAAKSEGTIKNEAGKESTRLRLAAGSRNESRQAPCKKGPQCWGPKVEKEGLGKVREAFEVRDVTLERFPTK